MISARTRTSSSCRMWIRSTSSFASLCRLATEGPCKPCNCTLSHAGETGMMDRGRPFPGDTIDWWRQAETMIGVGLVHTLVSSVYILLYTNAVSSGDGSGLMDDVYKLAVFLGVYLPSSCSIRVSTFCLVLHHEVFTLVTCLRLSLSRHPIHLSTPVKS